MDAYPLALILTARLSFSLFLSLSTSLLGSVSPPRSLPLCSSHWTNIAEQNKYMIKLQITSNLAKPPATCFFRLSGNKIKQ